VGRYHYARLGHGARPLELLPGGRIGAGAAGLEQWWRVVGPSHAPQLHLGARSVTAVLARGRDGIWRGRWIVHEQMPVELRPLSPPRTFRAELRAQLAHAKQAAQRLPGVGRGIVIAAGGSGLTTCAWVLVDRLRRVGCTLPIELWHLGEVELGPRVRGYFEARGVHCVDARTQSGGNTLPSWTTWGLKPFAVRHSRFREVLLLDADNVPLVDPTYLFDDPGYCQTGALFWPDYGRFTADHPAWELFDLPHLEEPEQESGQMVVDRARTELALTHVAALNLAGDIVYRYVHGDKDTWRLGFRLAGAPYQWVEHPVRSLAGTMVQHAPGGTPLFQHRNLRKWSLFGNNPEVPGFRDEAACREALSELKSRWSGAPVALDELPDALRSELTAMAATEVQVTWRGFACHALRLGLDQRILAGGSPLARRWVAGRDGERWALMVEGDRGPTARLHRVERDRWQGMWPGYPGVEVELTWRPPARVARPASLPVVAQASHGWVLASGPAAVSSLQAPRRIRARDDRPGFEPLDPGPLHAPDLGPGEVCLEARWGRSRTQLWRGPRWRGEPVDRLVVDLSGGLGDVVRWLPVLRAIARSGRARGVLARVAREPAWFRGKVPHLEVIAPGDRIEADAGLPAIHELPRQLWTRWPRAPLTALAARALDVPLQDCAGVCLDVEQDAARVRQLLEVAGWRGEPLVAVQADDAPPLSTPDAYAFRASKLSPALCEAALELTRSGAFVVAVGSSGPALPARAVLDLRDHSLGTLAGAISVSDVLLAVDSGPVHVAGVLGTPALALYGPSDPDLHLCSAGALPYLPPAEACPQLPCGVSSLIGQPQTARGFIVPMRCPPSGPCLHGLDASALARASLELARAAAGAQAGRDVP
jgi:hypothetical protein